MPDQPESASDPVTEGFGEMINGLLADHGDEAGDASGIHLLMSREHGSIRFAKTRRGGLHVMYDGPNRGKYISPEELASLKEFLSK